MRCQCCNKNLNDWESTLKSAHTGEYLDTCKRCLKGMGIETLTNQHNPDEAAPADFDFIEDEFLDQQLLEEDDE